MSPSAHIARDMNAEHIIRRMSRDSYDQFKRNEEQARKRAEKYKEQKR